VNSNSGYNGLFDPMLEQGRKLDFAQQGLSNKTVGNPFSDKAKMSVRNLNVYYDNKGH
jgi:phosphate transport system ATP-binding protein